MDDEIKKLMGLANLRNLSIKWNHTAMQKLAAVLDDQGETLISKGWGDTESYGQIFKETFQEAALLRRNQNIPGNAEDPEQDIVAHRALAEENPVDNQMLDIEHPRRRAVLAKRKRTYDARRVKRVKATKPKTVRISRRDVVAQSERSSSVELRLPQAVQQQEENKGGEEVEEENAAAVEEDNTGGGEELDDKGKENDSEEDEESESEEEIVEEEEVVLRNSRGRPITASSRDTVPINQSITYRRKRWA